MYVCVFAGDSHVKLDPFSANLTLLTSWIILENVFLCGVCVLSPLSLQLSWFPDTYIRRIGDSKLPVGVNLSVNSCLTIHSSIYYVGRLITCSS